MESQQTPLSKFWDDLAKFDWYYSYSDDASVWRRGEAESKRLEQVAEQSEEHAALMEAWKRHVKSYDLSMGKHAILRPERPEA